MDVGLAKSIAMGAISGITAGCAAAIMIPVGLATPQSACSVMIVCAVLGSMLHNAKQSINNLVDGRSQTLKARIESVYRYAGDIHGLVRHAPYTQELPLPLGGGWALAGDSAALLAREVLTRKPDVALELGSGASTLIIGQILKRNGRGRLISIDHDEQWAALTRSYVSHLGLEEVVSVIHAPLADCGITGHPHAWYDLSKAGLDHLGPVDLLLVDGPPQPRDSNQPARYPALPLLHDRLSSDSIVFVDDTKRAAEIRMLETWLRDFPAWHSRSFDTVDGCCILSRTS